MTTQKSTNNSFMLKYIRYKIGRHKGIAVVNIVFSLLCLPLLSLMSLITFSRYAEIAEAAYANPDIAFKIYRELDICTAFLIVCLFIAVISAVVLLITTIITPSLMYTYNSRKCDADMYLSLPLTLKQRFFGDFFAGAVINFIPLLLNLGMGIGFVGILQGAINSKASLFISQHIMTSTDIILYGSILQGCLFGFLCAFLIFAGLYLFGVFISSVCGRLADSLVFSLAAPLLLLGFVGICGYLISGAIVGIDALDFLLNVLSLIPPFGIAINAFGIISTTPYLITESGFSALFRAFSPSALIITAIVYAALLIGAYYLTKHRKAEKTGQPFVYNSVYYIMSCGLLGIIALFILNWVTTHGLSNDSILGISLTGIFVSAVMFFFIELAHNRGFKKIWQWGLRYVGTAAGAALLLMVIKLSGGFGIAYYVPDVNAVESVIFCDRALISYGGENQSLNGLTSTEFVFNSDEDKKMITSLHKMLIGQVETGNGIEFEYRMKNGTTVKRSYYIPEYELEKEVVDKLSTNDSFINQYLLFANEGYQLTDTCFFIGTENLGYTCSVNLKYYKELIAAIREDMLAGRSGNGKLVGYIELSGDKADLTEDENLSLFSRTMKIYDGCESLMRFLDNPEHYTLNTDPEYYNDYPENSDKKNFVILSLTTNPVDEDSYMPYVIRKNDLERSEVKELLKLLEVSDYYDNNPGQTSSIDVRYYRSIYPITQGYFINKKNEQKAFDILRSLNDLKETDFFI